MAPFNYRMHLADGEDFGDYASSEPNWKAGDELYVDGFPNTGSPRSFPARGSTARSTTPSGKSIRSSRSENRPRTPTRECPGAFASV